MIEQILRVIAATAGRARRNKSSFKPLAEPWCATLTTSTGFIKFKICAWAPFSASAKKSALNLPYSSKLMIEALFKLSIVVFSKMERG